MPGFERNLAKLHWLRELWAYRYQGTYEYSIGLRRPRQGRSRSDLGSVSSEFEHPVADTSGGVSKRKASFRWLRSGVIGLKSDGIEEVKSERQALCRSKGMILAPVLKLSK